MGVTFVSNDLRTPFEAELTMFARELECFFDRRIVSPGEYMEIRGKLRDLRVYLDNKGWGCPSGQHQGDCEKVKHERKLLWQ